MIVSNIVKVYLICTIICLICGGIATGPISDILYEAGVHDAVHPTKIIFQCFIPIYHFIMVLALVLVLTMSDKLTEAFKEKIEQERRDKDE